MSEPLDEVEERVRELEEYATETKIRLENGIHAFADLKKDLGDKFGELKTELGALKPKPPSVLQLFGTLFGAVVVILGAWWTLSEKFSDRPTNTQVSKMIEDAPAKADTVVEIKSLRDDIVQLKMTVDKLNTKLEVWEHTDGKRR
jgi:hypothetical protein